MDYLVWNVVFFFFFRVIRDGFEGRAVEKQGSIKVDLQSAKVA